MVDVTKRVKQRSEKGDGYIRKTKAGTYEATYYIHKKDETVIRKSFTRDTKSQVKDIIAHLRILEPIDDDAIKIEINKQTDEIQIIRKADILGTRKSQLNTEMTVDDYVDYWLWNHRRKGENGKRIKDTTFEDYVEKGNIIKRIIGQVELKKGEIHKIKVAELTYEFIEEKLIELFKETCKTTAIQTRNHIFNMMRYAKKDNIIKENPLLEEKINFSDEVEKFNRKIIGEEDIGKVIEYCLKHWYIDVFTQLILGARVSEIRGLCWENIIEKECKVHISKNYVTTQKYKLDKEGHIQPQGTQSNYTTVKSKSSDRKIEVGKEIMHVLMIHKEYQKELAKRNHIEFKETDPVFTGRFYKQLGKNTTNERIQRITKELQIKDWEAISSHCLRKSFCCAGIYNGVPLEYMSKILGHNSTKVTELYYLEYKQEKIDEYAIKTNCNRVIALNNINNKYGLLTKV